ncbi:DUF5651 domain-containing protein [Petroclostridium sp. X23]|uniref:DUF5651 domain-containing protein n=1 Tax=Petroclostridium sp. X23 TaxID=3045146 RepID=UPI0024AE0DE0|nr:DUF5651 domain-containing protein [Petroclostridium sp. X23]WHH59131.1 DUF5651 domain-containing protein [Petroclostridium sp. X23]
MKKTFTEREFIDALKVEINSIGTTLLATVRGHLQFGQVRANRFFDELNSRLPQHIQYKLEQSLERDRWLERSKRINKDQLYDLAECLIAVNCNKSCNKKPEKCELRKLLKLKKIPVWNENGKCEYKIDMKNRESA